MTTSDESKNAPRVVSLRMSERAAAGLYSNAVFLSVSPTEVTLDCVFAVADSEPLHQARVMLPHAVAFALFRSLAAAFDAPDPTTR